MKKTIKMGLLVVAVLTVISVILGFIIGFLESFRIVFGAVYVLFIPGFIISFIFFPKTKEAKNKGEVDWIERVALSFALSIAIVPLAVFYLNLAGIGINLLNTSLTILAIILISTAILWKKRFFKRKPNR